MSKALGIKKMLCAVVFGLAVCTCLAQTRAQTGADTVSAPDSCMLIYVTEKGKVILNGKNSGLQRLDLYLDYVDAKKAKIGTVKPTPTKARNVFMGVIELCQKYQIEAEWYQDPEFSVPFFTKLEKKTTPLPEK